MLPAGFTHFCCVLPGYHMYTYVWEHAHVFSLREQHENEDTSVVKTRKQQLASL